MFLQTMTLFLTTKLIPLMYAIIGFSALIAIHEFGHFLFCKLFGIRTPTFSIGFGPEIFCKKIGTTNFRLAAIPIGGYVEIAGLAEIGQGSQEFSETTGDDSFESKAYWKKFLVLCGGIIFNLLFSYGVFCSLFMIGSRDPQAVIVAGVVTGSAAEKYGLKPGDALIEINDSSLIDTNKNLLADANIILLNTIGHNPNKEIILKLKRKNENFTLPITLGSRIIEGQTIGSLGAELRTPLQKLPFLQAIKAGINETNRWIYQIILSIKKLVTQHSLDGAGGPVMIMSMSFSSAQQGILSLLTFLALISINLALFNVLPIGALDGGQLMFVTIEAIIGRKIPLAIKNSLNLASWLLFIGMTVFLTYKDVSLLFGEKILSMIKKVYVMVTK